MSTTATPTPTPTASPSATSAPSTQHLHSTWNATIRTFLGAAAAVTLVLLAFAWPTHSATVHDMPLGVVGSAEQRSQLQQRIDAGGGAFTLHEYADEAAARQAIEHRDVYGALVMPSKGSAQLHVLTASAGSSVATQALTGAVQQMAQQQGTAVAAAKQKAATALATTPAQAAAAQASAQTLAQVQANLPVGQARALAPQLQAAQAKAQQLGAQVASQKAAVDAITMPSVQVSDVVPLSSKDPRGSGFAIAGLPLAMGGMIGGVMISTLVVGWKRRLAAIAGYGVLGGLGLTIVLKPWFGFVEGRFAMIWLVTGLAIAATAAFITGAQSLLGQAGIGLGAVLTMFVGNPISSMQMPKEWLPGPWGTIGQGFVPGAAGNLLRIESYFSHAPALGSWLVLLAWLGVGVLLTVIGRHKDDEVVHIEGAVEGDQGAAARALPRRALLAD